MILTINTPVGRIDALPSQAERIKAMSDEQLIASVDAGTIADPFEFQEILNRGLYSRTARYKAYYGESRRRA
jgi:hypothetical protein